MLDYASFWDSESHAEAAAAGRLQYMADIISSSLLCINDFEISDDGMMAPPQPGIDAVRNVSPMVANSAVLACADGSSQPKAANGCNCVPVSSSSSTSTAVNAASYVAVSTPMRRPGSMPLTDLLRALRSEVQIVYGNTRIDRYIRNCQELVQKCQDEIDDCSNSRLDQNFSCQHRLGYLRLVQCEGNQLLQQAQRIKAEAAPQGASSSIAL